MKTLVQQFSTVEQAGYAAADHIVDIMSSAVSEKGLCTIVLAGGQTPKLTYRLLSEPPRADQIPWQQCHFFWGDERWLSPKHPDSNFSMAHKALLSKVAIPQQNVHQIPTGDKTPDIGAEMYEIHLRDFFHSMDLAEAVKNTEEMPFPSFDLVLLGMGTDGHTASLFPGSNFLEEKKKWVTDVNEGIGSPPVPRITLTLPVINRAKNVLFLISGKEKRAILDTFIDKPGDMEIEYPAAHIKPTGQLIWIVAEEN